MRYLNIIGVLSLLIVTTLPAFAGSRSYETRKGEVVCGRGACKH